MGPVMVLLEREVALVMKLSSRGEARRSLTVRIEEEIRPEECYLRRGFQSTPPEMNRCTHAFDLGLRLGHEVL